MGQKTGFLFPGQGAQFVGMGKTLCDNFAEAREVFTQADQLLGYSIQKICFEGPEDEIVRTVYAQPAIFVTSIAALKVLQAKRPQLHPAFAAGLSLGEFTALVAAGSISFVDGLNLVRLRAEAMERAAQKNPGTMASIMGLDQAACEETAREAGCEVANLNSPDQIVLSGTAESIQKACVIAEQKGAKRAIPLKVGGAFHSSLMQDARDDLKKALADTEIKTPQCAFIPNVKAVPVSDPSEIRELLAVQLTSSVRWVETMAEAKKAGLGLLLEVGPGKVLKGLARKCDRDLQVTSCGEADDFKALDEVFAAAELS